MDINFINFSEDQRLATYSLLAGGLGTKSIPVNSLTGSHWMTVNNLIDFESLKFC